MKTLIKKLTETFGPSGFEQDIRKVILDEVEESADEIHKDPLGNLIVRKGKLGKKGKRIMLAGHMDEIGLIVTHVDTQGYVRFSSIGFLYPHTLIGGRVRFSNGVSGVIGSEQISDLGKTMGIDKLFIDVGASSFIDSPVRTGDTAAFERPFFDMGKRLVAKAFDDRIGCAVMISALKDLRSTPNEIFFVFTTQEEVGLRGATTSAYGIDPEIGISLDVTMTGDTPKARKMDVSLGKGPAIKIKDGGMISDARIVNWMVSSAGKYKIPYQREVLEGGTTDARMIQVSRAGVLAGCISIPCRYVHTPSEMVDVDDVLNTKKLLLELISHPVDF